MARAKKEQLYTVVTVFTPLGEDGERDERRDVITHVYGPYTQAQSRYERKILLEEARRAGIQPGADSSVVSAWGGEIRVTANKLVDPAGRSPFVWARG
jgi:hypothetical protein